MMGSQILDVRKMSNSEPNTTPVDNVDIVAIKTNVKFEGLHIFFISKSSVSKIALPLDQDFSTRINLGIN